MKVYDPLSPNYFRLHGLTVDQPPDSPARPPVSLPGLVVSDQEQSWEVHQASWFSASRELDQAALGHLLAGREEEAECAWSADPGLESRHNLTILTHLRLLREPASPFLWTAALRRWRTLASETSHKGYEQIGRFLAAPILARIRETLASHAALEMRRFQEILRAAWPDEEFQELESSLFDDDLKSLEVRAATLRQGMLNEPGQDVLDELTLRIETDYLPLAEFLREATVVAGPAHYETLKQSALLYRALSRAYRDVPRRDLQLATLESACAWAPIDLREEIMPELEHVRFQEFHPVATVAGEPIRRARVTLAPALGALLLLLILAAGVWTINSGRSPTAGYHFSRQATEARTKRVLQEIDTVLRQMQVVRGGHDPNRETRLRVLKQRHTRLVDELARLEQLRNQMQH